MLDFDVSVLLSCLKEMTMKLWDQIEELELNTALSPFLSLSAAVEFEAGSGEYSLHPLETELICY